MELMDQRHRRQSCEGSSERAWMANEFQKDAGDLLSGARRISCEGTL